MSSDDAQYRRLRRITLSHDPRAEWELDLRGLDELHARASVERMIERNRFGEAKNVLIRFEPATPGGGETLFQPIGRLLIACLKRGWVTRVNPLSAEIGGGGFYVEMPGHPGRAGGGAPNGEPDGEPDGEPNGEPGGESSQGEGDPA